MAVKTEKGSEVKDFTNDPIDNDKLLGYNQADGTRWWSLSRFWNWIKSKTASTITAGDKTPVNADAVNGALTNYANVIETEDLNTLVPNADGKPRMWYSPSGSPANRPNESNIWAGIVYNLWGYPVQIAHSLGNVMFTRTGFPYNNSVAWNSWTQVATKSDLANYINTRWVDITSSDYLIYTGKSITIPAGRGYSLRFENIYVLAEPRQIGVSASPNVQGANSWDYLALSPEGISTLSLNGYASVETTLYIYAKSSHATANGCWISVDGFII